MAIVIFIAILVTLIIGHEFGHFIAAKLSGMKVPEFGLGFPPKIWGKKIGDTEYTVNALPFGGFVRITGEDANEVTSDPAAFSNRPKAFQAAVLLAGPFSNVLLAFLFSTLAFMAGVPASLEDSTNAEHLLNPRVLVVEVLAKSPAAEAGIKTGDRLISISAAGVSHPIDGPQDLSTFVGSATGPVSVSVERGSEQLSFEVSPITGLAGVKPGHPAIGVASVLAGTLQLPFPDAVAKGFTDTLQNAQKVCIGLVTLIGKALTLSADVSNVAGPVGIASIAGDAFSFGLGSVFAFASIISINLGILNLLPFPALDGGRLLFVAIETLTRKRIHLKVANTLNFVGFSLLILLMLAVTAHDIFKLVT